MSRRVLILLFTVATLVAACTGEDAGDDSNVRESSPAAEIETLEPAWTAQTPRGAWSVHDVAAKQDHRVLHIGAGQKTVMAFDTATGVRKWKRTIPGSCGFSAPNHVGDIAVTFGGTCDSVAVIDGSTGKMRWRIRLPATARGSADEVDVGVGDRAVAVVQGCGPVTRLSLSNGKRLGTLQEHDRICASDTDGQLVARWGQTDPHQNPRFELYDVDSGERIWRRATDARGSGLTSGAIVNTDPLIVALTENAHRTMRRYDRADPASGRVIGRRLDRRDGVFEPIGIAEGVLVGTYRNSGGVVSNKIPEAGPASPTTRVFAYDLDSGRELWSRAHPTDGVGRDDGIAGVDQNGIVVVHGTDQTDADDAKLDVWVERWDLRTGKDAGVHGRIELTDRNTTADDVDSVWGFTDGILYRAGSELSAYELRDVVADGRVSASVEWDADDVQPDPLSEPCAEVRPATLRRLGLRRSASLPTPADCTWVEYEEPESSRGLEVNLAFAEPGGPASTEQDTTAVENAKRIVEQRRQSFHPGGVQGTSIDLPMRKPGPVDGIGNEAYASAAEGPQATGAYLLVREHNVVLEIRAGGGFSHAKRGSGQPSLSDAETGLLAVAQEVFGQLDLDVASPKVPRAGKFDRVDEACDALRAKTRARGLANPVSVMPHGSDDRVARCASIADGDHRVGLNAYVYAAAGSPLTGKTGEEIARTVQADAARDSGTPIDGLGDRAIVQRDDREYGERSTRGRRVTARSGNLVVQIDYSRWGASTGPQVERDAIRMARTLLASAQ